MRNRNVHFVWRKINYGLFILLSLNYFASNNVLCLPIFGLGFIFFMSPFFSLILYYTILESHKFSEELKEAKGNFLFAYCFMAVSLFMFSLWMFMNKDIDGNFSELFKNGSFSKSSLNSILNLLYTILIGINLIFPVKLHFYDWLRE